jgi:uncharacterized membrane protein
MSVPDVVPSVTSSSTPAIPDTREARQLQAERDVVRASVKGLIVSLPISIAVLIGMMAIAIGDVQPWYVWVALGVGMGVYAAGFLGTVSAVLVSSHKLDEVDADD